MNEEVRNLVRRHVSIGWWGLFLFGSVGLVLEVLHAFKIGWYLNVSNETRRFMWTLGHAHGTLLSLINLALAGTAPYFGQECSSIRRRASGLLVSATILLPGGFFLGGWRAVAGDPGAGVILVPLGAIFLLLAMLLLALAGRTTRPSKGDSPVKPPPSARSEPSRPRRTRR